MKRYVRPASVRGLGQGYHEPDPPTSTIGLPPDAFKVHQRGNNLIVERVISLEEVVRLIEMKKQK